MTLDEAKSVAKIVETAEGGCGGCINEAARELDRAFPDFVWTVVHPKGHMASINVRKKKMGEAPSVRARLRCD